MAPHGTDVNAVDRSRARAHLVTADDFGGVNVFNYPVVVDEAPSRREAGHSSHVMNVRFSPTDAWVVSVGGKDRAVFQWRFARIADRAKRPEPADPPWARVGEVDAGRRRRRAKRRDWKRAGGGAGRTRRGRARPRWTSRWRTCRTCPSRGRTEGADAARRTRGEINLCVVVVHT